MKSRVTVLRSMADTPRYAEDVAAAAAIMPGMLVERNSSNLMVPHATAGGGAVVPIFAVERDEMGKTVDDAYAIGDKVKVYEAVKGDRINALLKTGNNAAVNAKLESAGDGSLRLLAAGVAVAQMLEAVNNATGSNARVRVQIL